MNSSESNERNQESVSQSRSHENKIYQNSYSSSFKEKIKLKTEIRYLKNKREELKEENEKYKTDEVSEGEIANLKTKTIKETMQTQQKRINELLEEHFKIIQYLTKIKTECYYLEEEIKEEAKRRETLLQENETIHSIYDFHINLTNQLEETIPNENYNNDAIKLKEKYEEISKDIMKHYLNEELQQKIKETLKIYSNKIEKEYELKSIPIKYSEIEYNELIKLNKKIEKILHEEEYEITIYNNKINFINQETERISTELITKFNKTQINFTENIEHLNETINSLKLEINKTSKQFSSHEENIKKLHNEITQLKLQQNINTNENKNETSIEENILEEEEENDKYIYNELKIRKEILNNENQQINNKIEEILQKYKTNEQKLKTQIKNLQTKYEQNKRIYKENYEKYLKNKNDNHKKDNLFHDNVNNLINNIDNNIKQIKNFI